MNTLSFGAPDLSIEEFNKHVNFIDMSIKSLDEIHKFITNIEKTEKDEQLMDTTTTKYSVPNTVANCKIDMGETHRKKDNHFDDNNDEISPAITIDNETKPNIGISITKLLQNDFEEQMRYRRKYGLVGDPMMECGGGCNGNWDFMGCTIMI